MLFNSIEFLIFFAVVITAYFILKSKHRWILLLAASYYFYMSWNPAYIILIILSTVVDYFAGLKMGTTDDKSKRKKYLFASLFINLGMLFFFKYYNFFNKSFTYLTKEINILQYGGGVLPTFDLLLPVGISFYTFQTLSYTIDVYRGEKEPEKHFGIFALYVSFFPQLVAGPIERSTRLLPQFKEEYKFDYIRVTDGLKLMLWGFFKKVVVADRLAIFVNGVYNDVNGVEGIPLILATVFFAFQIYCDFSGYSDIAIGAAQVMGFNLMDNFKRPYFSKSIPEFWRRWHISLSTWFKDYVYIPLGGNRVSEARYYANLFITFLISGLWHGAAWTFVIWGALHGFYQIFSLVTKKYRVKVKESIGLVNYPTINKYIQIVITFILVDFAWIFFRANSLTDAWYIIDNLFSGINNQVSSIGMLSNSLSGFGFSKYELVIAVGVILIMEAIHLIQRHGSIRHMMRDKPIWVRWSLYYALIFMILILGIYGKSEFIYFQF
jgi:D-alanyl-lipoteichoic acid acyltransferase DltB (MBOAT superfamily)